MVLLLKNLLFTVLVPGMVAVYVPLRWLVAPGSLVWPGWNPRSVLAALCLTAGAAVYFTCLWEFGVRGRGTPAPIDAPKRLVVDGLYRYVRNPMYIGVLLVVVGWAVLFGSAALVWYPVWVAPFFHLFVVLVEEPILAHTFGAEYARYRAAVRRWIPGRPYPGPDPEQLDPGHRGG